MGHPGSLGLLVSFDSAIGSFAQARDAAQWEEEEEHADHNLKKVTIERRKKGLHIYRRDQDLRDSQGALMQQSKLFKVVFLHKVQKTLSMYWGDVGIKNL